MLRHASCAHLDHLALCARLEVGRAGDEHGVREVNDVRSAMRRRHTLRR